MDNSEKPNLAPEAWARHAETLVSIVVDLSDDDGQPLEGFVQEVEGLNLCVKRCALEAEERAPGIMRRRALKHPPR